MNKKERAAQIVSRLEKVYPNAACALEYGGEPWKLLVMGILSAQCTDKRVNIVCRGLFERFPDINSMADASPEDIEELIRSCGLYKTKAKNINACCKMLIERYGAEVPHTMEELLSLPGVGRKIANLILGDIYKIPSVVTDTHCIRLAGRMGLCKKGEKNPVKVEKELVLLIAPDKQVDFCHRLVMFGREYCSSRSPRCSECPIAELCKKAF